jgi:carboxypeptidase family protein
MTQVWIVSLVFALAGLGQERFGDENPRLKGFAKSPTEHILNEHPHTIVVRSVVGRITAAALNEGVPNAVVEIKREGSDKVRGAIADGNGRFRIKGIADGKYIFKVTRDGFQSVYGTLQVSRRASRNSGFSIELKQGV